MGEKELQGPVGMFLVRKTPPLIKTRLITSEKATENTC